MAGFFSWQSAPKAVKAPPKPKYQTKPTVQIGSGTRIQPNGSQALANGDPNAWNALGNYLGADPNAGAVDNGGGSVDTSGGGSDTSVQDAETANFWQLMQELGRLKTGHDAAQAVIEAADGHLRQRYAAMQSQQQAAVGALQAQRTGDLASQQAGATAAVAPISRDVTAQGFSAAPVDATAAAGQARMADFAKNQQALSANLQTVQQNSLADRQSNADLVKSGSSGLLENTYLQATAAARAAGLQANQAVEAAALKAASGGGGGGGGSGSGSGSILSISDIEQMAKAEGGGLTSAKRAIADAISQYAGSPQGNAMVAKLGARLKSANNLNDVEKMFSQFQQQIADQQKHGKKIHFSVQYIKSHFIKTLLKKRGQVQSDALKQQMAQIVAAARTGG